MLKIVCDSAIPLEMRMLWRKVITASYETLSPEEKNAIPPFYIYNTMLQCISETFLPSHPFVDKICDRFCKEKVWSFCFFQDPDIRNPNIPYENFKRILVASSRNELTPDLSPELVILHELAHFIFFELHDIPYNRGNKDAVEMMCNKSAIERYVKLLIMNPQYSTSSQDGNVRELEATIKYISKELEKQKKEPYEIIDIVCQVLGEEYAQTL